MKTRLILLACCAVFSVAAAEDAKSKAAAPIPLEPINVLSDEEEEDGWILLFNGKKLSGFQGLQKADLSESAWKVKDGELFLAKEPEEVGKVTGGDLICTETFLDFEFAFDFKVPPSGNAGVLYMGRRGAGHDLHGFEYQIADDDQNSESRGAVRRTGALDKLIAPSNDRELHPPGEWNSGKIVVHGARVEHWLNGKKVVDFDLTSTTLRAAARAAKLEVGPYFGSKYKAPILLLDQGSEVAFRNLKLRPLPPTPAAPR